MISKLLTPYCYCKKKKDYGLMKSIQAKLLVGFRFRPGDEELIRNYLLKTVNSEELS